MATITATVSQTVELTTQLVTATTNLRQGPVAQTLPSLTQAATGETDFFTLIDTVTTTDYFTLDVDDLIVDTVLVVDTLYAIVADDLTDTVTVTDEFTYNSEVNLVDVVTAVDSFGSIEHTTNIESESRGSSFEATFSFDEALTDTVTITEAYTIDTEVPTFVDIVTTSDELTASNSANITLEDTVTATDEFSSIGLDETLTSTATATDEFTFNGTVTEVLSDTVTTNDEQTHVVSSFEELLDTVTASDLIIIEGGTYTEELEDEVTVTDNFWAKDTGAVAWVMNTETSGLSTYDNFEFTSITEYNGVLYATSPEGVFQLTGDDDNGTLIEASVKTGFLDFGSEQTKRMSDVFLGYTGGQFDFDVETYDGPQEVYTYTMEERDADAPRNNRIKVGRGLSSRYWRFSFRNLDGADFQVYDVSTVVGVSKRRL